MISSLSWTWCRSLENAALGFLVIGILGTTQVGAQIAIARIEELQEIGRAAEYPLDGDFVLIGDIDAAQTASWNGGAGLEPIGDDSAPFCGSFDGQGFDIVGLSIDRGEDLHVGLFGVIGPEGLVRNLGLVDARIRGSGDLGGLAGWNVGVVSACFTTGEVSGSGNLGGVVGRNGGVVSECYSGTETYCGYGDVGGLVGLNDQGTIILCYATGGTSCDYGAVGGLVGWNAGTVATSSATGLATGEGSVGGLIGTNVGTVGECFATGQVTCGYGSAGGLVGWNRLGTVTSSYALGPVYGGYYVAGLVGMNVEGLVSSCYSTGTVTGGDWAGGLVAENTGAVESSFWDVNTSLKTWSDGGIGLNTEEMQTQRTLAEAGWNFATVWYMMASPSYPHLSNVALSENHEQEAWKGRNRSASCQGGTRDTRAVLGDRITLCAVLALLSCAAPRASFRSRLGRGD